jgi:hypothetical protein
MGASGGWISRCIELGMYCVNIFNTRAQKLVKPPGTKILCRKALADTLLNIFIDVFGAYVPQLPGFVITSEQALSRQVLATFHGSSDPTIGNLDVFSRQAQFSAVLVSGE